MKSLLVMASLSTVLCGATENPQELNQILDKAVASVVFIAQESNPFHASFGHQPGGIYEYIQPFYEYMWPPSYSHGSGFIVSSDGYIVTCAHCTDDGTDFRVLLSKPGSKVLKAKLVGQDFRTDIAVLKIVSDEEIEYPYVELADPKTIQVGQHVFACGHPIYENPVPGVTEGVISAVNRNNYQMWKIEGYIQTDAAMNGGNSGGPLFNQEGKVVGINSFVLRWANGMGFSVPSFSLRHVSDQLIKYGKVKQGYFGVGFLVPDVHMFNVYRFEPTTGAEVNVVYTDSPADKAGLKVGDIIVQLDGYSVGSPQTLRNLVCVQEPGSQIVITVNRNGELIDLNVTLGSEELSARYSYLSYYGDEFSF